MTKTFFLYIDEKENVNYHRLFLHKPGRLPEVEPLKEHAGS